MKDYLRRIDTTTRGRYDVTPLFADYQAFQSLVEDICQAFAGETIHLVAGIDALGFILGAAVAVQLRTGFVPVRKGGKLPGRVVRVEFVDYSGESKALEMRQDAFWPGARVLLVDEWIETGAQIQAAVALVEGLGGQVAGIATINLDRSPATLRLKDVYRIYAAAEDFGG